MQHDGILAFMRTHGSITAAEAMNELGCMRLSARIFDLRRAGYNIVGVRTRGVNRFDQPIHFMRYVLADGAPEVLQ